MFKSRIAPWMIVVMLLIIIFNTIAIYFWIDGSYKYKFRQLQRDQRFAQEQLDIARKEKEQYFFDSIWLKQRLQYIRDMAAYRGYFQQYRDLSIFGKVHILAVGEMDTSTNGLGLHMSHWSLRGDSVAGYNYTTGQLLEISNLFNRHINPQHSDTLLPYTITK